MVIFPDPIVLLRAYLKAVLGVPVSFAVPADFQENKLYTAGFITLQSTGGARLDVAREKSLIAVQAWAANTVAASDLARRAAAALDGLRWAQTYGRKVANCVVSAPYIFTDPDSNWGRYQITAGLTLFPESEN